MPEKTSRRSVRRTKGWSDEMDEERSEEGENSISSKPGILDELEESGVHGMPLLKRSGGTAVRLLWGTIVVILLIFTVIQTCAQIIQSLKSSTSVSISYSDGRQLLAADFMIVDPISGFANITDAVNAYVDGCLDRGSYRGINGSEEHQVTLAEMLAVFAKVGWYRLSGNIINNAAINCSTLNSDINGFMAYYMMRKNVSAKPFFKGFEHYVANTIKLVDVFYSCTVWGVRVPCEKLLYPVITQEYGFTFASNLSQFNQSKFKSGIEVGIYADWNRNIYNVPGQGPLLVVAGTNQMKKGHIETSLKQQHELDLFVSGSVMKRLKTSTYDCLSSQKVHSIKHSMPLAAYSVDQCKSYKDLLQSEIHFNCSSLITAILKTDYVPSVLNKSSSGLNQAKQLCPGWREFYSDYQMRYYNKNHNTAAEYGCLQPCDTLQYYYTSADQHSYVNTIRSELRKVTVLRIRLADTQFPVFTEQFVLQWYEYLGLIGGSWGLWLGFSIMTIVHLVGRTCNRMVLFCRNLYLRNC